MCANLSSFSRIVRTTLKGGFQLINKFFKRTFKQKSLFSKRFGYNRLLCSDSELYNFIISPSLRKSCHSAYQKSNLNLERQKEEKKESSSVLK